MCTYWMLSFTMIVEYILCDIVGTEQWRWYAVNQLHKHILVIDTNYKDELTHNICLSVLYYLIWGYLLKLYLMYNLQYIKLWIWIQVVPLSNVYFMSHICIASVKYDTVLLRVIILQPFKTADVTASVMYTYNGLCILVMQWHLQYAPSIYYSVIPCCSFLLHSTYIMAANALAFTNT